MRIPILITVRESITIDAPPEFEESIITFSIAENAMNGDVVGTIAVSDDKGTNIKF